MVLVLNNQRVRNNYNSIDKENILIDIDTLNNKEFIKMLGQINTGKKYQIKKGDGASVK